jgi:MoxR-like ATPase
MRNYIVKIIRATRENDSIELGASPRASLSLSSASQSLAAIRGRDYVIPDDIKYLTIPVLAHRLMLKTEASLKGQTPENLLRTLLTSIPVPVEK